MKYVANEKHIGSEERNIEGMLLESSATKHGLNVFEDALELPTKKRLVSIHSDNDSE